MSTATLDQTAATAAHLLRRVFATAEVPLCFRLWDGTQAHVGADGVSTFEVVLRSRAVLRRLLRRPTPLRFGEAFISGDIDIEGDLFAAMHAGTVIERLRLPLGTKLAVLARSLIV